MHINKRGSRHTSSSLTKKEPIALEDRSDEDMDDDNKILS